MAKTRKYENMPISAPELAHRIVQKRLGVLFMQERQVNSGLQLEIVEQ
jgi:hypothetical protein